MYLQNGWALFRPAGITLANGKTSLLNPPVVEEHRGKLYVAEGHHHLYTLQRDGVKSTRVAVAQGIKVDLPMSPTSWRRAKLVSEEREKGNPQIARYIETHCQQGLWSETARGRERVKFGFKFEPQHHLTRIISTGIPSDWKLSGHLWPKQPAPLQAACPNPGRSSQSRP